MCLSAREVSRRVSASGEFLSLGCAAHRGGTNLRCLGAPAGANLQSMPRGTLVRRLRLLPTTGPLKPPCRERPQVGRHNTDRAASPASISALPWLCGALSGSGWVNLPNPHSEACEPKVPLQAASTQRPAGAVGARRQRAIALLAAASLLHSGSFVMTCTCRCAGSRVAAWSAGAGVAYTHIQHRQGSVKAPTPARRLALGCNRWIPHVWHWHAGCRARCTSMGGFLQMHVV